MSRVKGRDNRATEVELVKIFRTYRIKGWRRNVRLYGKPDFIFRNLRIAVLLTAVFGTVAPSTDQFHKLIARFGKRRLHGTKKGTLL